MNQIAKDWKDYEVIDTGNKEKLERWNHTMETGRCHLSSLSQRWWLLGNQETNQRILDHWL